MGFIRNNDDLAAHINTVDPHTQYLTNSEAIATFTAAIAAHSGGVIIDHGLNATTFDCNNWEPASRGGHLSALNTITLTPVGENYTPIGLQNIPTNVFAGKLIQLSSELSPSYFLIQFFVGQSSIQGMPIQLFLRSGQKNAYWTPWFEVAFTGFENVFSAPQTFGGGLKIGTTGTQIKKILSQVFWIDPPLLSSGQIQHPGIPLTIQGAAIGDFVQIAPIGADIIYTGIWPFEFRGVVTATNVVTIYPLNDWTGGNLDLAPLQIRAIVMGF